MMMETITKKSATQLALENLRSYIMDNSVRVGDQIGRASCRERV